MDTLYDGRVVIVSTAVTEATRFSYESGIVVLTGSGVGGGDLIAVFDDHATDVVRCGPGSDRGPTSADGSSRPLHRL